MDQKFANKKKIQTTPKFFLAKTIVPIYVLDTTNNQEIARVCIVSRINMRIQNDYRNKIREMENSKTENYSLVKKQELKMDGATYN